MSRLELAQAILRKADQDKTVFDKLRPDPEVAVYILGFHAQQAAEKMLKALLASKETDFPFSHRLADLFDLVREKGVSLPEELEELRFLTPFAVAFRYELYEEDEEEPFDSERISALLDKLRAWTTSEISARPADEEMIDRASSQAAVEDEESPSGAE